MRFALLWNCLFASEFKPYDLNNGHDWLCRLQFFRCIGINYVLERRLIAKSRKGPVKLTIRPKFGCSQTSYFCTIQNRQYMDVSGCFFPVLLSGRFDRLWCKCFDWVIMGIREHIHQNSYNFCIRDIRFHGFVEDDSKVASYPIFP